jgi:hypothetical protein
MPRVLLGAKRFIPIAVALAAIGCFALIVGGHDVFVARGLGPRLFGALLAVAGLIMLIAAAGVFGRAAWHVALSLVGGFAAVLVGVALLLAQLDAGERGPLLFVWVGVIVAGLIAFALSLVPGAPQVSSAVRRVQFVAVGGILIGVAQFVFTTVYGPTPAGPHLEVTSALERVGEKNGLVAVRARITFKNSGQRSIVIVDSVYRVAGALVAKRHEKKQRFLNEIAKAAARPFPGLDDVDASRGVVARTGAIVQAGQIISRGFWFEPGESSTREFILHVPARSYDLIGLSAELTIAEHRLLNMDDDPVFGPNREERSYYGQKYSLMNIQWSIDETSWVQRLISGENVLWSRWMLAGPAEGPVPTMFAYVDKEGAVFDPWVATSTPSRISRLNEDYGMVGTYTHAELSLFPAAAGG